MDNFKLPPFRPITNQELRQLWKANPTGPVRHLVLEVERYRRLFKEIDGLYLTTHEAWRRQIGGDLAALHLMKSLMFDERGRTP